MTRRRLFAAAIGVIAGATAWPSLLHAATCTGKNPCNACKNCKYCARCGKGGGTCGTCRKTK